MSPFVTGGGGITKLSQLTIDADKDWQLKGISNIKELALAMIRGDFLVHDGTRVIALHAGNPNLVLTSSGPGTIPTWQPGGTYFNRFIPATISLSKTLTPAFAPTYTIAKGKPLSTALIKTYLDDPGENVKQLTPTLALTKALTGAFAATYTTAKTGHVGSKYDLQGVVEGAVSDFGGALTDETAAAQNVTANDMHLLRAAPVVGDGYDFGHSLQFDVLHLNIGTAGAGAGWTITWKYWNGAAWANLAGIVDGTNNFQAASGFHDVTFTRPGAWALSVIQGHNLYWIRGELTAFGSIVTQPLGTQAFIIRTT